MVLFPLPPGPVEAPLPPPNYRPEPGFVRILASRSGGPLPGLEDPGGDDLAFLVRAWKVSHDVLAVLGALGHRLRAKGAAVGRIVLNVATLHPEVLSYGFRWSQGSNEARELEIARDILQSEAFQASPLLRVVEHGETIRRRLCGEGVVLDFPVLHDLLADGLTDYLAMPLPLGRQRRSFATFASDHPDGFSQRDIEVLKGLAPGLGMMLETHALNRIAGTLLDVYLGRGVGERVLAGEITRGSGEAIRAILWASDLERFTTLSDQLPGEEVVDILNRVFEPQVEAVGRHGGEVLKFVGDGLLAIFPIHNGITPADAAARALAAAREARLATHAVDRAVAEAHPGLGAPLSMALHEGTVFFGNIGGANRLDFTVIGPAVNQAARVEKLTRTLGRRLLVTRAFVDAAGTDRFESLGLHALRGVAEPIEVLAPLD